eukprot:366437-Chlamydomonas_euryale.AAC.1
MPVTQAVPSCWDTHLPHLLQDDPRQAGRQAVPAVPCFTNLAHDRHEFKQRRWRRAPPVVSVHVAHDGSLARACAGVEGVGRVGKCEARLPSSVYTSPTTGPLCEPAQVWGKMCGAQVWGGRGGGEGVTRARPL